MSNQPAAVFLASGNVPLLAQQMIPTFNNDAARFQLLGFSNQWDDVLRDGQRLKPDVMVIDAGIAPDPETLKDYLAKLVGIIAVVILPPDWADFQGQFEAIQGSVRGVFIAPVNWVAVANSTYTAVQTERVRSTSASPLAAVYQSPSTARLGSQAIVGTKTIAFCSFSGGSGKSSLIEGVAATLGHNNIRTLLCSFNFPAAAAGHFRLGLLPSATEWFNRPSLEGFQASLQKMPGLDALDVLMAPHDYHLMSSVTVRPMHDPASIYNLVLAAGAGNYAVILLDLPPFNESIWAMQAVLAANTAVLVCRLTRHEQLAAIQAYHLLTRRFAEQIRIPADAIYAVANFISPTNDMSERDFQAAVAHHTGTFPPFIASFPYTPELPAVQTHGVSPLFEAKCDAFSRVARSLAGKLVGSSVSMAGEREEAKPGLKLGRFKFSLG